jgi:hypothetical protein
MKADRENPPAYRSALSHWSERHPLLEITTALFGNLVLVGLFAYYPAQWLGLW